MGKTWLQLLQQFCDPVRGKSGDAGTKAIGGKARCVKERV